MVLKLAHCSVLGPGNIFLDREGNIRLGDFGLATKHTEKVEQDSGEADNDSGTSSLYNAIEDISHLLGGSRSKHSGAAKDLFSPEVSNANESMTGGVGTTFYRAPEQEGNVKRKKGHAYTVQADIFSFGVVLFEMFQPPFATYMERAENLTRVRGDHANLSTNPVPSMSENEFQAHAKDRFPDDFRERVPQNAQRLILWCLARDPRRRPSADQLLKSDLLPRKIELEQRYLSEALQLLTSSHSESYIQILDALFKRPVQDIVAVTYDTDMAVKAPNLNHGRQGKRVLTASEALLSAVSEIRAGAVDIASISSLAMSDSSLVAATAALKRAANSGKLGKGGRGMLKRATQRTAGILAMRAAAAAAVTGNMDGVHGADPTVVETFCNHMKQIFESHGAVRLRSPLLRPRVDMSASSNPGGPAELLNTRGVVLVLPEDLTAPFARAIGRGGSATTNIKRYDVDRTYHRSLAGGHPRETLEASFDIVHEDHSCAIEISAETLMVGHKVIELLPASRSGQGPWGSQCLPWFVRINHTRLAEAILDLCGVPTKESIRRAALTILGRFTAPTVYNLKEFLMKQNYVMDPQQPLTPNSVVRDRLEESLDDAHRNHGLPKESCARLQWFIDICGFLPPKASQSIERLKEVVARLRTSENSKIAEPKILKRFEDAARSLKVLRDMTSAMESSLQPLINAMGTSAVRSAPLFVSIDFGLRQRRKHYHGGLIFQYIVLPDGFLEGVVPDESTDALLSHSGSGVKVAEGGDFSDLVRRNRPPGNFASTFLNRYTASPIPFCCGVRFAVGKLVELSYLQAVFGNEMRTEISGQNDIVQMRKLLGHPLSYSESVRCVVASVHGMDAASSRERFKVASHLWSSGIQCEYLPHSGLILSLLKRIRDESMTENSSSSDWSLVELYGVCALLKIPFVVIVQPHLLRDKNSVRLRRINFDTSSNHSSAGEIFVSLEDLASTIMDDNIGVEEIGVADESAESNNLVQVGPSTSNRSSVECIYVENDCYYGIDREVSKSETPHWKSYMKSIKKVEISAESFTQSLLEANARNVPVFAVADASFWSLRDFGTALMRREREQSAAGAYSETSENWPRYKRSLKTLSTAIDTYMRRNNIWISKSDFSAGSRGEKSSTELLTILLYSKPDDRFDVVTLSRPHRVAISNNPLSRRR